MPFKSFDNFIFDLDGTLIDSAPEVLSCIKRAFDNCNVSFDESRLNTDIMGPTMYEIVKLVNPTLKDDDVIQKIVSEYRYLYDNDENDITKLYPNIKKLLETLKRNNKKIFIATNKPKIPTLRLVKQLNINFFDDIYTVDKYDNKKINKQQMIEDIVLKYNLGKEKTIMIGDCLSDIEAGIKAQVKTLVALWGYGKDKNILKTKSDFNLEKIND